MVSKRKRKKDAAKVGLTEPELHMLELLDEILEKFRWMQVLVHAQSFVLRDKLKVSDEELHRILAAATQAIEKDSTWLRWEEGLGRLKGEVLEVRRAIRRERKKLQRDAKAERGGGRASSAEAAD